MPIRSKGGKLGSDPNPHRGRSAHSTADNGETAGVARAALKPYATSLLSSAQVPA